MAKIFKFVLVSTHTHKMVGEEDMLSSSSSAQKKNAGRGGNADYKNFLLFSTMFPKAVFLKFDKTWGFF